jgi:hypothetical protein
MVKTPQCRNQVSGLKKSKGYCLSTTSAMQVPAKRMIPRTTAAVVSVQDCYNILRLPKSYQEKRKSFYLSAHNCACWHQEKITLCNLLSVCCWKSKVGIMVRNKQTTLGKTMAIDNLKVWGSSFQFMEILCAVYTLYLCSRQRNNSSLTEIVKS